MPSGRTHLGFTAGLILVETGLFLSTHHPDLIPLIAGTSVGLIVTPDLDLAENGMISHGMIRKYGGAILEGLWYGVWYPYGKLISHRSWVSHAPIISTVIRVLYLLLILSPVIYYYRDLLYLVPPREAFTMFMGLAIADLLHITLDHLTTAWKRAF